MSGPAPGPGRTAGGCARVLVVDDTAENRQLVEANLAGHGYAVTLAENGARAVALFEETRPDLVLLDILMPGMDGFETLPRLRALPGGADTPIVVLTALGDLDTHARALESGADDFLTKPINRTELLMRVRSLLRLKRAHDRMLAAQRQKQELTDFIVHDLKNPLMGILANAQFIDRDPGLRDDTRRSLRDVLSAGESLHRMITNLTDISRSRDGQLVPVMEEFDLAAMVREVARAAARRAETRRQQVDIDLRLDPPLLRGDRDLIRRLLDNLIDNALRYAPPETPIGIELFRQGGLVELRVRDRGPGVPAELRARIFDKDAAPCGETAGTARAGRALGLVFCSLAVEAHGGRIRVEDNVPDGSVFCVSLPLDR